MKLILLISLSVCGFFPLLSAQDKINSDKTKHHIYLLIGQSNMAGRAKYSAEESEAIKNAFLLTDKNEWLEATNPLNRYSSIRKDLKVQRMGLGYYFAKTLTSKNEDITLGLVVNAKGGTKIAQWKKGTKFFNDAVIRTKNAMESGTLKGILWHQGEGDKKNKKYIDDLSELVKDLRSALEQKTLPFVAGEVRESIISTNKHINQLPKKVENTAVASSKGLKTFDGSHFDATSTKILGERFAEAMTKLSK